MSDSQGNRPVIQPGIERFTAQGRKKVYKNLRGFGVLLLVVGVVIGVPPLIFGTIRITHGIELTRDTGLTFLVLAVVVYVFVVIQQLSSLKPGNKWVYFDARKLAQAYGLEGFYRGKIIEKSNGEIEFKLARDSADLTKVQPMLEDFKVEKSCLPISYPAIAEIKDPQSERKSLMVCGLDFTEDGVSLEYNSHGSFPKQARSSSTGQSAAKELALKG